MLHRPFSSHENRRDKKSSQIKTNNLLYFLILYHYVSPQAICKLRLSLTGGRVCPRSSMLLQSFLCAKALSRIHDLDDSQRYKRTALAYSSFPKSPFIVENPSFPCYNGFVAQGVSFFNHLPRKCLFETFGQDMLLYFSIPL